GLLSPVILLSGALHLLLSPRVRLLSLLSKLLSTRLFLLLVLFRATTAASRSGSERRLRSRVFRGILPGLRGGSERARQRALRGRQKARPRGGLRSGQGRPESLTPSLPENAIHVEEKVSVIPLQRFGLTRHSAAPNGG